VHAARRHQALTSAQILAFTSTQLNAMNMNQVDALVRGRSRRKKCSFFQKITLLFRVA
jgi:hypothetical protein